MTKEDFDAASRQLTDSGLEIADAHYDERAFGSWFIEIATPPRRLVWDGKDGLLVVQEKRGFRDWGDLWLARGHDRSIANALRMMSPDS